MRGAVFYDAPPPRLSDATHPMTDLIGLFSLRRRSIAVRLAVSALLASSAILLIAAWILTTLYRENTERAFDSRLLVFANNLATDLVSPERPREPRLHRSATRASTCRCPAGTGRSASPTRSRGTCAPRARSSACR